ncbi:alkane 1-monooxygenase [Rhodobacteraceae bacterium CCMM004]|nr:alkane 1-monooxygenase [Rhodobacteraceae bacterium CCMM004]
MRLTPPLFALATLAPAAAIGLAILIGGVWSVVALLSMTLLTGLLDHFIRWAETPREVPPGAEFPAGDRLCVTLGAVQIVLIPLTVLALSSQGDVHPAEKVAIFLAAGLWLGQVGNANAHELIHRGDRRLFRLGRALFITLLFGHHTSAHRQVHHPWVATPRDPSSARLGEGYYRFLLRSWRGNLRAGFHAERALLERRHGDRWWRYHPYTLYALGAVLCLAAGALLGGVAGVLWYLALAGYAQSQILLSDYVQHYGLRRAEIAPGKYAPVGPQHSWNAGHGATSALMLNAPRHSDHHARPTRPWTALELPDEEDAPRLPYSLPAMATIALVPPIWRRMMDPRARAWAAQDRRADAA